jgi:hypothetical protein
MKMFVRIVALLAGALLIFVALAMVYSTVKGYTAWFFRIPGAIFTVNGARAKGWLHRARNGRAAFFTVAYPTKSETYDLVFGSDGKGQVLGCGTWVAPRLPVIPIGDVIPPCFLEGTAGRNLTKELRSVAFITKDGAKLEARW